MGFPNPGTGGVATVTAADASITVAGTASAPTVATSSLDVIASNHSTAGDVSLNNHRLKLVSSPGIGSDGANKTYVDNVAAGVNPAVAVTIATTAAGDTSGLTYANGVAGIGATLTGSVNTAITIDGVTLTSLNQRVLVKNDTQSPSGAFNGVYYLTQLQTGILAPILTRALDYDQPSDINSTGAIPVVSGTANGGSSWLLTSTVATIGTDALTYTRFTYPASGSAEATLTTTGDMVYASSANVLARRAVGATTGMVLTVSGGLPVWALPSGYQFDYVELTSTATTTATTAATAGAVIDGNAVTYDGSTRVKIEFYSPCMEAPAAGFNVILELYDGSTDIAFMGQVLSGDQAQYVAWFLTPSNAAHTYHIKMWGNHAGTSSCICGAGGANTRQPAWYRITKA